MTQRSASILVLIALFAGCSCASDSDNASIEKASSEELVITILDDGSSVDDRLAAIEVLKENEEWESLCKALPPAGDYDNTSLNVIDAIVEIGNPEALSYLESLKDTNEFVSGEFWASLDNAIERLKKLLENEPGAVIPPRDVE